MKKVKIIDKIIMERYTPGERKIKNKIDLDRVYEELTQDFVIKLEKNEVFSMQYLDNYLKRNRKFYDSSELKGLSASILSKYSEKKLEEIKKEEGIKDQIVVGRDCNLVSGYMIGISRVTFGIDYFNEGLDEICNKYKKREDFLKLKEELSNKFDLDDIIIFFDTGYSGKQNLIISRICNFKNPYLVLGNSYRSDEYYKKNFDIFDFKCLDIKTKSMESVFHPIDPFTKVNKIEKSKLNKQILDFCLSSYVATRSKDLDTFVKKYEKVKDKYKDKLKDIL